jgi:hypothetical protein
MLTEVRLLNIKKNIQCYTKCISDSALEIVHRSTREFGNKEILYYDQR